MGAFLISLMVAHLVRCPSKSENYKQNSTVSNSHTGWNKRTGSNIGLFVLFFYSFEIFPKTINAYCATIRVCRVREHKIFWGLDQRKKFSDIWREKRAQNFLHACDIRDWGNKNSKNWQNHVWVIWTEISLEPTFYVYVTQNCPRNLKVTVKNV